MSPIVATVIARGNVRWGSRASPAENVTYCQPSYAQRVAIIAAPTPAASDVAARGENAPGAVAAACPRERRIALKASSPPTLAPVIQFWTLALRRVPATLMAAGTAVTGTA